VVEVDRAALEQLLERVKGVLLPSDFELVHWIVSTLVYLTELLRNQRATLARLRRFLGHSTSEKLAGIAGVAGEGEPAKPSPDAALQGGADTTAPPDGGEPPPVADVADAKSAGAGAGANEAEPEPAKGGEEKPKKKVKGHGRLAASAYGAAEHIAVPHATLRVGGRCSDGCQGKLYPLPEPATIVRIFGQAPLSATCWDCEQLRCNTCGKVQTARAPEEAQGEKYDETAASAMVLLTYGTGMPFHRLARLQRALQTPVPASTQWDVVKGRLPMVQPVYDELKRIAAQGSLFHNDDSHIKILEFKGKRRDALVAKGELSHPERTGLFTTAVVSLADGRPAIALFFTGRNHAGENLDGLLEERDADLPPPIQMGDALTRNVPKNHAVVEANCLAHGRRKLFDEIDNYPTECRELLEKLGLVYKLDDVCKEKNLSPQERLSEHQRVSGPLMDELRRSMAEQLAMKRLEPNSGLGGAFNDLLKRWDNFTLFLRVPGAPLDNNICERALKMAIKHRNGSLFYRSQRGARVGDIYMTLLHTTELCGGNPFDYLTALQHDHKAVAEKPAEWLPWNYRDTLARMGVHGPLLPGSRRPAATPRAPPSSAITQPQAA
jgi:transposase